MTSVIHQESFNLWKPVHLHGVRSNLCFITARVTQKRTIHALIRELVMIELRRDRVLWHETQIKVSNKAMEEDKEVLKRYEEGTARIADPRYREDRSY